MQEKRFEEIFDKSLLENNTVMIDEKLSQNCDFIILELVKIFKYTVFQWNDSGKFLKSTLNKYNVEATINSIYSSEYNNEDIIDDVYVQKLKNCSFISKVNIFRSSTANQEDYYKYGIIIKVDKLMSGCSNKIDGTMQIFKRDQMFCNAKYKVFSDRIAYYE